MKNTEKKHIYTFKIQSIVCQFVRLCLCGETGGGDHWKVSQEWCTMTFGRETGDRSSKEEEEGGWRRVEGEPPQPDSAQWLPSTHHLRRRRRRSQHGLGWVMLLLAMLSLLSTGKELKKKKKKERQRKKDVIFCECIRSRQDNISAFDIHLSCVTFPCVYL